MSRRKRLHLSKMVKVFFQCLEERKWKDAGASIKQIQSYETDAGEEWIRGYTDALQGILIGLREMRSPSEPLIVNIGNCHQKELKKLMRTFYEQSRGNLNADYDRGFFRSWYDYAKFLDDKNSSEKT